MLQLYSIYKSYNKTKVLEDISFSVHDGEFVSILGASGSGKTTILRVVAGLEIPESGKIYINGKDVTISPASTRSVGMIFQNYSLFPSMTVLQNIIYPIKKRKNDRITEQVEEVIKKCELEGLLKRYPYQLSGGQQQRVAIARALAMSPSLMLFDEPFSALDVSLRQSLRDMIKAMQKNFHTTMLYVTHDQEEAFSMSDRIVVINHGAIQQIGSPSNILNHPANQYVEKFARNNIISKYNSLRRIVEGDIE